MPQQGCIAVLNAGSSSIKFALYEAERDGPLLFHGQVEGIGVAPHLKATDADGKPVAEQRWDAGALDHHAATDAIIALGRRLLAGRQVLESEFGDVYRDYRRRAGFMWPKLRRS